MPRPTPRTTYIEVMPRLKNPPLRTYGKALPRTPARRPQRAVAVNSMAMPAAISTVTTNLNSTTTISRTEQCFQITTENALSNVIDHPVNAANHDVFPWLSRIAIYFDTYRFTSLHFRYVPSCAVTQTGQITFAIDYDPCDANIGINSQTLAAMAGSVTTQLYRNSVLRYAPTSSPTTTHKFYTSQNVDYNSDARFNHLGRLLICYQANITTPTSLGTLYADYTVILSNPQDVGAGFSDNGTVAATVGGLTATDPLGTVETAVVSTTKPDSNATPAKTKRIVKIIDGIITVIGKVAPYIGIIAKLFLAEQMPLLSGHYTDVAGDLHPITLADAPGDTFIVLHSTQCRQGTIVAHFWGTFTTAYVNSYPVITLMCSTNITIVTKITWPNNTVSACYLAAVPMTTAVTIIAEFDFNDTSLESAWVKPVITEAHTNLPCSWTSIDSNTANYFNIFAKSDIVT